MYTPVAVGSHNIIVRGTLDGQSSDLMLSLELLPGFTVTAELSASGTVITVIIEATVDATFQCQLDNSSFVPCMLAVSIQANSQLITLHLCIFCTGISGFQFRGVSAGQHTIVVRATSTETGLVAISDTAIVDISELAIGFTGISGISENLIHFNN